MLYACRLSRYLRAIPAAQSERQALSGLDPFHLAHLALNDATKAAELAVSARAYELQVSWMQLDMLVCLLPCFVAT